MLLNFLAFVVTVLSLQFVLLGGCALTVLVGLYERFVSKKILSTRAYVGVILLLLFFACFQAWQQEHESANWRENALRGQAIQTGIESGKAKSCADSLRVAQDSLNKSQGATDGRAQQIASQQSSLSTCLVQLGKAQQSEPMRITAHLLRSEPSKRHVNVGGPGEVEVFERSYIILTSKAVTPIRLSVVCGVRSLHQASGYVAGTGAVMSGGWGGRLSPNSYGVGILSPAWTPTNPLVVTVASTEDPTRCEFGLQ